MMTTVGIKISINGIPKDQYEAFFNDIKEQFIKKFGNHFQRNDDMVIDYDFLHKKGLDDYFHECIAGALTLEFIKQDIEQEKSN